MRYLAKSQLKGEISAPPSKSQSHRAIIAASLADGESLIEGIQLSDDIQASIKCIKAMGARVSLLESPKGNYNVKIQGIGRHFIEGALEGKPLVEPYPMLPVKESGSTLRFFIPLAGLTAQPFKFVGEGKIGFRPLSPYQSIFQQQGLRFDLLRKDPLDLLVAGPLSSGDYAISGQVSSQFITGLLFALPLLRGDSTVKVEGDLSLAGYVAITLQVLEKFGINIACPDAQTYAIQGGQSYQAQNMAIEGDYSQAAVYLCADVLGHRVSVKGLSLESAQPDQKLMTFLEAFGGRIGVKEDGTIVARPVHRQGTKLSGDQTPDIMPLLALVACLSAGESHLIDLGRLRLKESDRLQAVQEELSKLGADIKIEGDAWVIQGKERLKGGVVVDSHQDHRIAMMLALASTYCEEGIYLQHDEVVSKSYPHFWEDWQALGGVTRLVEPSHKLEERGISHE